MPSGVTGNAAASDAEESWFDSKEGSVTIDWNSKTTEQLTLILGSLKRLQGSEKTNRQKEKTKKYIETISKILRERKSS